MTTANDGGRQCVFNTTTSKMFPVMFLCLLLAFASLNSANLNEPTFHVLSPNELMVELPVNDQLKLITFRIGVKRENNPFEDLEKGENFVKDNNVFMYDKRLNLKSGDAVNFLVAYKDDDKYQAQTGTFVFNGEYEKKPTSHRLRRHDSYSEEDDDDEAVQTESRFGGGDFHRLWLLYHNDFNGHHGHGHGPNPFLKMNHPYHNNHWERMMNSQCEHYCAKKLQKAAPTSTSTTSRTTSTQYPDIDIRFRD